MKELLKAIEIVRKFEEYTNQNIPSWIIRSVVTNLVVV
jgi:hypothetical protein